MNALGVARVLHLPVSDLGVARAHVHLIIHRQTLQLNRSVLLVI